MTGVGGECVVIVYSRRNVIDGDRGILNIVSLSRWALFAMAGENYVSINRVLIRERTISKK